MSSLNIALPPSVVEVIKSKWMERIVDFVLVPALLLYSLWLPPVSIGNHLFHLDYPLISEEGGMLKELNGGRLSIPAGALGKSMRAQISSLSVSTFLAGNGEEHLSEALDALPLDVILRGRIYEFDTHGDMPSESVFSVPLPEDAEVTTALDLYAWDGNTWQWVPSHVHTTSGRIKAELGTIPAMLAVVESPSLEPFITAEMPAQGALPELPQGLLTSVLLQGLYVQGDGTISSDPNGAETAKSFSALEVYPRISNVIDGVVRSDFVDNIIINAELTTGHISEIVDVVKRGGYPGVQMDYRGVDPDLRHEFSDFIAGLADALHSEGKLLSVMVELPTMISEYGYNSGAYDWRAIGKTADSVVLPIATTIEACASGGDMEDLLGWAVGEVHRDKLHLAISAMSYQEQDGETIACTYGDVLAELGEVAIAEGSQMLIPGESLTLELPKLKDAGGLNYDAETATYWYVRQDAEGREQKVYLTNAASVAYRLLWIDQFRLGGVVLADVCCPDSDPRIWDAVRDFRNQTSSLVHSDLSLVWTVSTNEGDPIGSQVVPLSADSAAAMAAAVAVTGSEGDATTGKPPSVLGAGAPGDTAFVWTAPNNPGNYIISLSISDDGGDTTRVQGGSVEVEVPTPTPSPTPTSTPTATPTPTLVPTATPKPKPKVVARSAMPGTGFGYGIQPDMVTDGDHGRIVSHVQQLGFGWIKQQVEWFRYNPAPGDYNFETLDRIVAACVDNGINVMFSVVKAPHWARPPGDTEEGPPSLENYHYYGEFLKAMAARYKGRVKAYEIWNEQNLAREWGGLGHKLNAGRYVELLKVAYTAIKSVDPGAIVVSGAPTPTGWNDGDLAIDDRVYLEQMYQAGLARYCDAVGVHPSGYNNPPDADWQTYQDPSAPGYKGHPSQFFRGTMESYRNIMVHYGDGHKRLWPTEFGWATIENIGAAPNPDYMYAADNTEAEQAQWLVRAYEIAKNEWDWVGVMFTWNLNFGPVSGKSDEKAAFGIVRPNWSPRPAFAALAHMPK